ncbi:MAG: hypothetical protein P1V35_15370, partial [Planctomycetota bacterium]|nr:hypothetical protein [Planctomycetota bacterium]
EITSSTTTFGHGSAGRSVLDARSDRAVNLDGVILTQGGGYIAPGPELVSQTTTYGANHGSSWASTVGDAGQVALVILMVWVGIKFLIALTKGVKVAVRFLFRVITFPFRVIGYVFRQIGKIPGAMARLFGRGRPAARKVTEKAGAAYTKVAEGWNHQEANGWPALKKARETWKCEKKHIAGMVGSTREKFSAHKEKLEEHKERLQEKKGHFQEQKRLLKKLGRKGYMQAVMAGGGAAVAEAAAVVGFNTTEPKAKVKPHTFPGYRILSEMPRGGSGAHLFLAQPKREHKRELAERGIELPSQVVIKSFSLQSGAHMTGILREGRALDAAKQLGQVLEHSSGDDGMYYVMPFVPGDTLDLYISKLHKLANGSFPTPEELKAELNSKQLNQVLGLGLDLISELERFHDNGLWHKDIKPGNLIVNQNRLHIVDLGLLTPLASALTLTTHGTEYFRDPEMVRLAMSGAQVRDVDAVKFDLYSAGAVLFSMLEGTFPAHGNLSRLQRPCPPALAWVVRRAMSEHHSRYASARIMRQDLAFLSQAKNLDKVKPVDLPSWNQESEPEKVVQPIVKAPVPEPIVEDVVEEMVEESAPTKTYKRSWTAVIPKKAAAAALVSIALLGAIIENERFEARARAAADNGTASQEAPMPWEGATEAGLSGKEKALGNLRTYSFFPKTASAPEWADTNELMVGDLMKALPGDRIKAVYIQGAELNELTEELHDQLESSLKEQDVKVLRQDDGASLELSARVASMLDALPFTEHPSVEDRQRFFGQQGEIQAIARFIEVPDGMLAQWVVEDLEN